jgi:hypothetical protein
VGHGVVLAVHVLDHLLERLARLSMGKEYTVVCKPVEIGLSQIGF